MATQIYKTIGTGGDYATIAAWIADIPSNLTAAGVDQIWTGYVLNQELVATGSSGFGSISSKTCDATHYIELTAQPGSSFIDHVSVLTNPLRYDGTKGAALKLTASTGLGLTVTVPYFKMSRLQMLGTDTSATAPTLLSLSGVGTVGADINQCIFEAATGATTGVVRLTSNSATPPNIIRNSLVVQKATATSAVIANLQYGAQARNCTFVSLNATLTAGITTANVAPVLVNCYVGGVVAPESGVTMSKTACYCSAAVTGYSVAPLSAATFVNVTAGSHDLRLAAGSALIDAGTTDATYAANGIYGAARPSGASYDVGAFEYVAPPQTLNLVGAGSTQDATSGTGAVSIPQTLTLIGAGSAQDAGSGTGAVLIGTPPVNLVGAGSTQDATSGTGAVGVSTPAAPTITATLGNSTALDSTSAWALRSSEAGITVHIYTLAGPLLVTKLSQVTNGSGVMTIQDSSLVGGTPYRLIFVFPDGAEGLATLQAVA